MKSYYIFSCALLLLCLASSLDIDIETPQNLTHSETNLTFKIIATENLTSAKYSLDSGDLVAMNSSDNKTWFASVNVGEGPHKVFFVANTTNESVNKTVWFTIDTIPPHIVLVSPEDNYTARDNVTLIYRVIEANPSECYLYVNSSLVDENNSPQNKLAGLFG